MTRSYAHENAANLPGGPADLDRLSDHARSAFERGHNNLPPAERPAQRGSAMVQEDAPAPAPSPPKQVAQSVNRAHFVARWQAEKHTADRENRRAAFIAKRKGQSPSRPVTQSHND